MRYRFHPLFGREVIVRVTDDPHWCAYAEDDQRGIGVRVPRWMFDAALCASLLICERPVVSTDALLALRRLLDAPALGLAEQVCVSRTCLESVEAATTKTAAGEDVCCPPTREDAAVAPDQGEGSPVSGTHDGGAVRVESARSAGALGVAMVEGASVTAPWTSPAGRARSPHVEIQHESLSREADSDEPVRGARATASVGGAALTDPGGTTSIARATAVRARRTRGEKATRPNRSGR